jgi:hypothetical protein
LEQGAEEMVKQQAKGRKTLKGWVVSSGHQLSLDEPASIQRVKPVISTPRGARAGLPQLASFEFSGTTQHRGAKVEHPEPDPNHNPHPSPYWKGGKKTAPAGISTTAQEFIDQYPPGGTPGGGTTKPPGDTPGGGTKKPTQRQAATEPIAGVGSEGNVHIIANLKERAETAEKRAEVAEKRAAEMAKANSELRQELSTERANFATERAQLHADRAAVEKRAADDLKGAFSQVHNQPSRSATMLTRVAGA